jgi:hypothetical protein
LLKDEIRSSASQSLQYIYDQLDFVSDTMKKLQQ